MVKNNNDDVSQEKNTAVSGNILNYDNSGEFFER